MQPQQTITDKQGRQYVLSIIEDSNSQFYARLFYKHTWVGEVTCLLNPPDEMELADIIIFDPPRHCRKGLSKLIPYNLYCKLQETDFRQRGLGTELLQIVIEKARQEGILHIRGFVTNEGLADNPNLLNWYAKHGFQITYPSPHNPRPKAAAWIHLELAPNTASPYPVGARSPRPTTGDSTAHLKEKQNPQAANKKGDRNA